MCHTVTGPTQDVLCNKEFYSETMYNEHLTFKRLGGGGRKREREGIHLSLLSLTLPLWISNSYSSAIPAIAVTTSIHEIRVWSPKAIPDVIRVCSHHANPQHHTCHSAVITLIRDVMHGSLQSLRQKHVILQTARQSVTSYMPVCSHYAGQKRHCSHHANLQRLVTVCNLPADQKHHTCHSAVTEVNLQRRKTVCSHHAT